jgi:Secretion system C-terminal sorting domain
MKKTFLSIFLSASATFVFAQKFPCISDYKIAIINNGGGNCPDTVIDGQLETATGSVTLTFDAPVDRNNLAVIVSVTSLDSNKVVDDVSFGPGTLNNNGTVTYCYYVGPNHNNNLMGHHGQFRFNIAYYVNGILRAGCGEEIPLPVNFKSFTATRASSVVNLKWTSASESNNVGYEVQRLIGTGTWQTISFVGTQATGASSSSELTYTFSDQNVTKGVSQYRIKQVDIDHKAKFSEIRAVRGLGQIAKTIVYPNPSVSGGNVNILFDEKDGPRDVSLVDMSGRVIRQWKGFTNNNLQIEKLTPGLYNLRVVLRETGEQGIEKIVVNKR